jgi:DNA-binding MurR/RpiR family transcriptional regulator
MRRETEDALAGMSRAEREVACAMLGNFFRLQRKPIGSPAAEDGVSEPTVIRFTMR